MKSFTLLAAGSLAATASATFPHLDPRQTLVLSPPTTSTSRSSTSSLPPALVSECSSKYTSLVSAYPTADQKVAEWFNSAVISGEATKTIVSACDVWDIRATVTPAPAVSSQWFSVTSARESFARSRGPELLSLVSQCIPQASTMTGLTSPQNAVVANLEQALVTNKAGCESWYRKWYGTVASVPKLSDRLSSIASRTGLSNSTTTTSGTTTGTPSAPTTTSTTASTGAQTSPSPSGNGAVRETGLAAMVVAVAGVVALL